MDDTLGAFLPGAAIHLAGAGGGPLSGLTFAAKDIFDIAGHVTGCGNPDWLASHAPAARTAPAIGALLAAGATLVGKTVTDELAFSLTGENAHYGTPVNSAAPGRIPGGSSSGSASAVAGGLVDTALGSDTGGSVRAPASFCGLYGLRPSHGAIPLDGVMPLAPSFDTVGWFARTADLLARVGAVLLPQGHGGPPRRILRYDAAFDLVLPAAREAVETAAARVCETLDLPTTPLAIDPADLSLWLKSFQALQWREIWQSHGDWVTATKPGFGPGIADRFVLASQVTDGQVAEAEAFRRRATAAVHAALGDDGIILAPTVPGIAPLKGQDQADVVAFRNRALCQLCLAGLARLPQVTLPLAQVEGCPVGISLIGPPAGDRMLLHLACRLAPAAGHES